MFSTSLLLAFALAAPVPVTKATAGDWPQWRGPNRDGVSAETGLLQEWPKEGPKLLWNLKDVKDIGTGYGCPAVVGDKIYLLGADGAKQTATEFVTCLNLKDGTRVWQSPLKTTPGKFNDGWGGGPRSTPTIDGDKLYVLGATGDLVCLGRDKGEQIWAKNLVSDYKGQIPTWGYSESVLIDGDRLICTPGNKGGVIALDKSTGKTLWNCNDITDGAGYSSVIMADVDGVKQYIQQSNASAFGIRTSDGKLLWKAGEIGRKVAVIPSPVFADNFAFFTAGYGAGCECFKLEKEGDGTKATKVYSKNSVVQNHHGGVVRFGDYVYGHSDSAGWVCFNFKTGGEEVWKNKGVGKGSIGAADGNLYCYSENEGTLALVKATEAKYEEKSRFKIPQTSKLRPGSGKVWAHPVISHGMLFLRDYELFYVYQLAK